MHLVAELRLVRRRGVHLPIARCRHAVECDLAKHLERGLSRQYLGETQEYLRRHCVALAELLLRSSSLNVRRVASVCI